MRIGINGGLSTETVSLLKSSAVDMYRCGFKWTDAEGWYDPHDRSWGYGDYYAQCLRAAGSKWLPFIMGPADGSDQYKRVKGNTLKLLDEPGWELFVTNMLSNYGDLMWGIELWHDLGYPGALWESPMSDYPNFAKEMVRRIRRTNKEVRIVGGTTFTPDLDWYRAMFDNGLLESGITDIGVMWYYHRGVAPAECSDVVSKFMREIGDLIRLKDACGGRAVGLVVSEIGIPSHRPGGAATLPDGHASVSELVQASLIEQLLVSAGELGLTALFIHSLIDISRASVYGDYCGLAYSDLAEKAAMGVVRRFANGTPPEAASRIFTNGSGKIKGMISQVTGRSRAKKEVHR